MQNHKTWLIALVVCLLLVTLLPLASSAPDGLERVAEDKGFSEMERDSPFSVMADYVFPGIKNEAIAVILAGWLGTVVVFLISYGCAQGIYRLKGRPTRS